MSTDKSLKHLKSKDTFLIANVSNYFWKHSGRGSSLYIQLQKKPISHFLGQLWKSALGNENIFIPYSVAISSASFIELCSSFT